MSTNNFSYINNLNVIEPENYEDAYDFYEWEPYATVENIYYDIKAWLDRYYKDRHLLTKLKEPEQSPYSLRSYEAYEYLIVEIPVKIKKPKILDIYTYIEARLTVSSGYYTGCNLEWLYFLHYDDGYYTHRYMLDDTQADDYDLYDDWEDAISDAIQRELECKYITKKQAKYYESKITDYIDWLEMSIKKAYDHPISKYINKTLKAHTIQLNHLGTMSNGEAIYKLA